MRNKLQLAIIFSVAIVMCLVASYGCRKNSDTKRAQTVIRFEVPNGFPDPVYDFAANPVTEEGFTLGKSLFHDNRLSKGLDVSCGSCHQQMAAYTTFDHDLGHGTNNQHTTRNVPGIFNMAWHKEFEWDGSVSSLNLQVIACLEAGERMDETAANIITKLDTVPAYRKLFSDAFGDENLSEGRIADALSQFVVMLVSANSKYDRVKSGSAQFTTNEAAGYNLFKNNCASCHAEPLFTDLSYRNIGLPHRDFHEDAGRMTHTGSISDSLKFKVPSLRNVGITSYYAHDGRFAGISEMIEHYSSGVVPSATVEPGVREKIPLTNLEKFYLQEFLLTLSDSLLTTDERFE